MLFEPYDVSLVVAGAGVYLTLLEVGNVHNVHFFQLNVLIFVDCPAVFGVISKPHYPFKETVSGIHGAVVAVGVHNYGVAVSFNLKAVVCEQVVGYGAEHIACLINIRIADGNIFCGII